MKTQADKKRLQPKKEKHCEQCSECTAIGEGDFLCCINYTLVISSYEPTYNYSACERKGGAK